jgi:ceramide glucosyltransferase
VGVSLAGFWAELDCAFLNTLQTRWQYVGKCLGFGLAQGKKLLLRCSLLGKAAEPAEDAAATKLVRRLGLHVHLVGMPFAQPLGRRSLHEVAARQLRWARLRRATFPLFFLPEIVAGPLLGSATTLLGAAVP